MKALLSLVVILALAVPVPAQNNNRVTPVAVTMFVVRATDAIIIGKTLQGQPVVVHLDRQRFVKQIAVAPDNLIIVTGVVDKRQPNVIYSGVVKKILLH